MLLQLFLVPIVLALKSIFIALQLCIVPVFPLLQLVFVIFHKLVVLGVQILDFGFMMSLKISPCCGCVVLQAFDVIRPSITAALESILVVFDIGRRLRDDLVCADLQGLKHLEIRVGNGN